MPPWCAACSATAASTSAKSGRPVSLPSDIPCAGWSKATTILALFAGAFAWVVRGTISLDGLYHVALSRKLVELDEPTFSNINRFADGGPNPVYALPGWHALVGWTGWLTGSDPIIAWEIFPVLVVVGANAGVVPLDGTVIARCAAIAPCGQGGRAGDGCPRRRGRRLEREGAGGPG